MTGNSQDWFHNGKQNQSCKRTKVPMYSAPHIVPGRTSYWIWRRADPASAATYKWVRRCANPTTVRKFGQGRDEVNENDGGADRASVDENAPPVHDHASENDAKKLAALHACGCDARRHDRVRACAT